MVNVCDGHVIGVLDEVVQVLVPGVLRCLIPITCDIVSRLAGIDTTHQFARCSLRPKVADVIRRIWLRRKDTPLAIGGVLGGRRVCKGLDGIFVLQQFP